MATEMSFKFTYKRWQFTSPKEPTTCKHYI